MDKIDRIKRLVESSLKSSFENEFSINEVIVLPTQKYDSVISEWVPDSHTIFLSLKRTTPKNVETYYHYETQGTFSDTRKITNFLETLLGLECCVDFI
jgi:hypothetical protein